MMFDSNLKAVVSKPTNTKVKGIVGIANKLYTPVKLPEITSRYKEIKPYIFSAIVDNKVEFLEFISEISMSKSIKAYANDLEPFKFIVANIDNLSISVLDNLLKTRTIKQWTYIYFLKSIKHPIIKEYKSKIVEPLIKSATRLVVKLAKEVNLHIPFEDRVMLGIEGLVVAAWRYEPESGFAFTTYARNWIRQRMFAGIDTGLKVPSMKMVQFHKLYPLYKQYKEECESTSIEEFVKWLKSKDVKSLDVNTIKIILSASSMLSYESLAQEYENRTSDDFISDDYGLTDNSFTRFVEDFENREYMEKFTQIASQILTQLEYKVFMLLTFGNCKREDVQVKMNLKSKYEVDKLFKRAVSKLRNIFPAKENLIYLKPQVNTVIQVDNIL